MSYQGSIFDLLESERRKDEGIALVTDHNIPWMDRGLQLLERAPYMVGPFEKWRDYCVKLGLETPTSPNAWGALARTGVNRRFLAPTGRWVKMRDVRSHARRTPEYATCRE